MRTIRPQFGNRRDNPFLIVSHDNPQHLDRVTFVLLL